MKKARVRFERGLLTCDTTPGRQAFLSMHFFCGIVCISSISACGVFLHIHVAVAHQVLVHFFCTGAPLGDRVYHERLSAAAVARGKDAG